MAGIVVDMKMKSDDKNKALEAAIGQIEKAFGKGSVMKLGRVSYTHLTLPTILRV